MALPHPSGMRIETDVRKMYSVGTMKSFVQFIGIRTDEKIAVFFAESLLCLSYLRIITIFTIYTFWMIRSNSYTNRTFDALTSKSFADSLKLTNIFFFRSILNIIGFSLMLQDIVGNESLFLQLGNRLGQFIIQIASLSPGCYFYTSYTDGN